MINIRTEGRNGDVVSVALARDADDAMFITESGMIVRTTVSDISSMGRNTQGVRLVNLKGDDKLVALEIVSESDLEREAQTSSRESEGEASSDAPQGDVAAEDTPADGDSADEPTTDDGGDE